MKQVDREVFWEQIKRSKSNYHGIPSGSYKGGFVITDSKGNLGIIKDIYDEFDQRINTEYYLRESEIKV